MRILSLYDGMSCGYLALQKAGIHIDRYVAYEIDKYAIKTGQHNFPMIEHKGDVFGADFTQYEGFDFVIGGSPCTYWSIAQKNNRETEASGMGWELFSQYVRAIREVKPKWFIYENNKSMSKQIRASIDEAFGFEAVCINSALVSAQNRQRLYWVGVRNEDGTYSKIPVEQPEDLGIMLRDVLDNAVAWQDKAFAYTTRCQGAIIEDTLAKHRHTMVAEPVGVGYRNRREDDGKLYRRFETHGQLKANALTTVQTDSMVAEPLASTVLNINPSGKGMNGAVGRIDAKSRCLTTNKGEGAKIIIPVRVGTYPNNSKNPAHDSQQYRIYSTDGKGVTLCGNGGGMGAKTGLYAIPTDKPIYEVKDGMITIKGKRYPIKLVDGYYIIRKLTVKECMRLQTVPEWYEWPVSDSQAYKMLGNGWTVDVIVHLLNACKEA